MVTRSLICDWGLAMVLCLDWCPRRLGVVLHPNSCIPCVLSLEKPHLNLFPLSLRFSVRNQCHRSVSSAAAPRRRQRDHSSLSSLAAGTQLTVLCQMRILVNGLNGCLSYSPIIMECVQHHFMQRTLQIGDNHVVLKALHQQYHKLQCSVTSICRIPVELSLR